MPRIKQFVFTLTAIACIYFFSSFKNISAGPGEPKDQPKIVNIVNFIRLLEPRDSSVTEDVLYQTVVKQVEIMKKYKLGGTFLLQYDALLDPRYQKLLKSLPRNSFEIGAWWEIPQPLVENAGLNGGAVTRGIGALTSVSQPGTRLKSAKNWLTFICATLKISSAITQNLLLHGLLMRIR